MEPYCDHRNNEILRYIETENYLFMMNTSDDFNIPLQNRVKKHNILVE